MSKILCIVDGMTDSQFCDENYENIFSFPEKRMIQTIPEGYAPESHACIPFILGVEQPPMNVRGWLEALGAGILHKNDDIIFRGTWVKLHKDGVCVTLTDVPENLRIDDNTFRYNAVGKQKSIFVFEGLADRLKSVQTANGDRIIGRKIADLLPVGLTEVSRAVSKINAANTDIAVVLWGASSAACFPRREGAIVCGANLVKGIAKSMEMELCATCRMTGDTDTDLHEKVRLTLDAANRHSFVVLHIGGADEASHRMDRREKERFLQRVDEEAIAPLLRSKHDVELVSDHGAEPETGAHSSGLQPSFRRFTK